MMAVSSVGQVVACCILLWLPQCRYTEALLVRGDKNKPLIGACVCQLDKVAMRPRLVQQLCAWPRQALCDALVLPLALLVRHACRLRAPALAAPVST